VYFASILQRNATMPAGPSEAEVSEQDRTQLTHKWKVVVSCGICTVLLR